MTSGAATAPGRYARFVESVGRIRWIGLLALVVLMLLLWLQPPFVVRQQQQWFDATQRILPRQVTRLREMSPLWEMYKDGIDLSTVQWAAH